MPVDLEADSSDSDNNIFIFIIGMNPELSRVLCSKSGQGQKVVWHALPTARNSSFCVSFCPSSSGHFHRRALSKI